MDAKFEEFNEKANAIAAKIMQLINSEGEQWNHTLGGLWIAIHIVIKSTLDGCPNEMFKSIMKEGAEISFRKFVLSNFKK
jgi:hypothetical protein